jgi:hypothetical protein
VSEEYIASIFKVKEKAEQDTSMKAGSMQRESQLMFLRNTSPPSSGSKNKSSKIPV